MRHLSLLLVTLIAIIGLKSCFIADNVLTEDKDDPEENLQLKAELAVTNYVNTQIDSSIYTPYGFSPLKIIKPYDLVELDELKQKLKETPGDTSLANQYKKKQSYIKENRIRRKAQLDHFFTLKSDTAEFHIMEISYLLSDTISVLSTETNVFLTLPQSYETALDFYFHEYTIFIAQSYSEGRRLSRQFYRYFKNELENRQGVMAKSAFLKHVLEIVKMVKPEGTFNQDQVVQKLLRYYIERERDDINAYEPLQSSTLYETKHTETDSLIGYYFFHKFTGVYQSEKDTNLILVECSPYYEINQIFQLEGTFEEYVNTEK